jgi:uncharacterized protein YkwD
LPVRRALAVLLALPVLASIYLVALLRRGPAAWAGIALTVGGVGIVAAAGLPTGVIGAPTATQAPLAGSALGPAVVTGTGLQAAMIVEFDAPMDTASVEGAVRVDPASDVRLGWSDDGTQLIVEPVGTWRSATYYTITVGTAAQDLEGRALGAPVRAGFLTRQSTSTSLAVAEAGSTGVPVDSSITLSFDRPVDVASVVRAFRISPAAAGTLYVANDGPEGRDPALAEAFVWQPEGLLAAKTRYTASLAGAVIDAEGATVTVPDPITFATAKAPSVVRFRPRAGSEDALRTADVSVRFTMPMDRASTRRAFSVEVDGKAVSGRTLFAEDDTVLVFDPEKDFPYDAKVVLRVADEARSKEGTPIVKARSGAFTVEAKPKPAPKPKATTSTAAPKPTARTGSATRPTSSSSLAAEKYLLTLMNRERAAKGVSSLAYHAGVSDKVARPYAKKLAVNNVCSHFYGGTVGDRLRAAGYTGYQWAENLGCRYFADPRDAAESLVRFFKGSPGHYTNMMSSKYTHAGIGLWVTGGRLRFVAVFYTP